MNFAITTDKKQLKEILTMSLRNNFYPDLLWLDITGTPYPPMIKRWKEAGHTDSRIKTFVSDMLDDMKNPLFNNDYFTFKNEEGRLIGFLTCSYLIKNTGKCMLEYLLVDKEYRGNGYSHQILNSFYEWCKERKYYQIKIQFEPTEQHIHLYTKHGFKHIILEKDDLHSKYYVNWYKIFPNDEGHVQGELDRVFLCEELLSC